MNEHFPPLEPPDKGAVHVTTIKPSLSVFTIKGLAAIQYPNVYSYTTLPTASHVFDQMPKCPVDVRNATITGCTDNGHEDVAFDLFMYMPRMDIEHSHYTFTNMLRLGSWEFLNYERYVHFVAMTNPIEPPNGIRNEGKHYHSMWQSLFEIDTRYVPIKPIGRGAYDIVCSSVNRETNEKVAIKNIENAFENRTDMLRTLRELKLLRQLHHLLWDLKYLHPANILHRDLKPGNLLINANCNLKICDSGFACTHAPKLSSQTYATNLVDYFLQNPSKDTLVEGKAILLNGRTLLDTVDCNSKSTTAQRSLLALKREKYVAVLHRKMIHTGSVQAAKVLIKWKALPPKHGTWECSSLRTRVS